jgi:hypothetical protein
MAYCFQLWAFSFQPLPSCLIFRSNYTKTPPNNQETEKFQKIDINTHSSPSPLTGEGLPCGVCFATPQGKGEGEKLLSYPIILSYSRKRVSMTLFFLILFLDSCWSLPRCRTGQEWQQKENWPRGWLEVNLLLEPLALQARVVYWGIFFIVYFRKILRDTKAIDWRVLIGRGEWWVRH